MSNIKNEKIFVDTSAWFSIMNKGDKYHEKCKSLYKELLDNHNNLITSNLIIGETFTLLRNKLRPESSRPFNFLELIDSSRIIEKIMVDKKIEEKAVGILKKYRDHRFSYVDAVSFALMNGENVQYALTLDKHFAIAGFVVFGD